MKHTHIIFLVSALAVLLSGCDFARPKADNFDQSPEMQAAGAAERLGDFDKAINLYAEAAAANPKSALPYLQMALIFHEKKKDYIGAVYNYQRYIALASASKDSKDSMTISVVSNRVRIAGQLLAAQYVSTVSAGNANANVEVMNNIAALNKKVSELEKQRKTLASSNEVLRTEIITLNNRITRQSLLIDRMKNSSDGGGSGRRAPSLAGIVRDETITNDDGTKTTVQTYEVKSGDTLSKIAEIAYGDGSKWPRIQRANPDKVKNERVKPGDILIIP